MASVLEGTREDKKFSAVVSRDTNYNEAELRLDRSNLKVRPNLLDTGEEQGV